jgi:xanthine/uracil permease
MQIVTFTSVGLVAVHARGTLQRLLILVGLLVASGVYALLTNGLGLGRPIDLSRVAAAPWFGLPHFATPMFETRAMLLIAPVAAILVAENLGHLKAVGAMTGRDLDPLHRTRLRRRRRGHDAERLRRRHRRHHLRREHRRDGSHPHLFDRVFVWPP